MPEVDLSSSVPVKTPVLIGQRLKKGGIEYLKLLWDYRVLFLSGVVLFGPSILLLSIAGWSTGLQVCKSTMLCTNGGTPWGVVSSIFLYDSWENIPAYFLILVAYLSLSDGVQSDERRRRARFTSVAVFAAAFVANALWLLAKPLTYSLGPSGVVYALWGVLLAFTLFDGLPKHARTFDPRAWYKDKREKTFSVSNLAIFAATAIMLSLEPALFLSASPGINIFAHAVSFLGGYFSAQAYSWNRRHKDSQR